MKMPFYGLGERIYITKHSLAAKENFFGRSFSLRLERNALLANKFTLDLHCIVGGNRLIENKLIEEQIKIC